MIPLRQTLLLSWWHLMPSLLAVVMLLIVHAAFGSWSTLRPLLLELPTAVLFFACMLRPSATPYIALFVLGVARDTLLGYPLGMSSLLWMTMRLVVLFNREQVSGQGFIVFWAYFAVILLGVMMAEWACLSLWRGGSLSMGPLIMQYLVTLAFYPALHRVLIACYRLAYRRVWYLLRDAE